MSDRDNWITMLEMDGFLVAQKQHVVHEGYSNGYDHTWTESTAFLTKDEAEKMLFDAGWEVTELSFGGRSWKLPKNGYCIADVRPKNEFDRDKWI